MTRIEQLISTYPEPEICAPDIRAAFEVLQTCYRRGGKVTLGIAWEAHMYARPWDFRLEDICFPVHLLHGEADLNVPVAIARKIAATSPGCQATIYPGEGHIAVLANHIDEVIQILPSAAS